MKLYTIGYGGRQPQEFIALLQRHGVRTLVDVRLRPDRASMGIYAQAKSAEKGIQGLLAQNGIQYVSILELGNIFREDEHWQERYRRLMKQSGELLTERLLSVPTPFCLMCAERRFSDCHRFIIAERLAQDDWTVEHIE